MIAASRVADEKLQDVAYYSTRNLMANEKLQGGDWSVKDELNLRFAKVELFPFYLVSMENRATFFKRIQVIALDQVGKLQFYRVPHLLVENPKGKQYNIKTFVNLTMSYYSKRL